MTKDMTVSPSLLSTTATLPLLAAGKQGSSKPQWQIQQVGAAAKGIHVMRLAMSSPRNPFAKLVIELGFVSAVRMVGRAMLPIRIRPADAVTLQVDDNNLQSRMETQMTKVGAEVKLDLDGGLIEHLQSGEILHLFAKAASNGKQVHFAIPLTNFAEVSHQLNEISRQKPV